MPKKSQLACPRNTLRLPAACATAGPSLKRTAEWPIGFNGAASHSRRMDSGFRGSTVAEISNEKAACIEKPMNRSFSSNDSREANRFRSRSLRVAALSLGATAVAGEATASIISDLSSAYSSGQTFSLDGTAFGEIELVLTGMAGMLDLSLDAPVVGMMGDSSTLEFAIFSSAGMMTTNFLDALSASEPVDGSLVFASEAFLADNGVVNPS